MGNCRPLVDIAFASAESIQLYQNIGKAKFDLIWETTGAFSDLAFGDLNGDGVEDAVVVLVTNPGGTGRFYDLAPVLNQNGTPKIKTEKRSQSTEHTKNVLTLLTLL